MRRRDILLAGAIIAWVVAFVFWAAAAGPSERVYRLGFLTTAGGPAPAHEALTAALAEFGYHEGRNLIIERRYAAGDLDRLPALAADLVRANVDVIVTQATPAAVAAKHATARIPIVMASSGDAVGSGLVASLARPGGNVTGISDLSRELDGKRVELLRELKPDARRIAYFANGHNVAERLGFEDIQTAAATFGMTAILAHVALPDAFEPAFATMAAAKVDVAIVSPSPSNEEGRDQIVAGAATYRLPTAYGRREFAQAGGLVAYGTSRASAFRRTAVFVDKILRGADPAELPVQREMKPELVINLATARTLGIAVPRSLLARADEVIE